MPDNKTGAQDFAIHEEQAKAAPRNVSRKEKPEARKELSPQNAQNPRAFVVGIVRGSHGLTGEFKVESTSGHYEHFANMDEVTLRKGNAQSPFKVEYVKDSAGTLYMKLEGIDAPDDVLKINGWELTVPRAKAHALKEDEWYIEDLKGCSVWYKDEETARKETVGTVTNVMEGGGAYLLELRISGDCALLQGIAKPEKEVFVPFSNKFIGLVDTVRKEVQLMHLWILG